MSHPATETRTADAMIQAGAKNTGKTQATLTIMNTMVVKQGKPVLVLDINGQEQYNAFQEIRLDDIEFFNTLARRSPSQLFRCRIEMESEIDLFFALVHLYVKNAFVVFEDCTSYMSGNLSQPKKTLILNTRNASNDILFNGHSLGDLAPFLLKNCETLLLRQTSDNMDALPPKVPCKRKVMAAMHEIVTENRRLYSGVKYKLASRLIDLKAL